MEKDKLKEEIYLCLNTRCNYCRDVCGAVKRYRMDFNSPREKLELIYEIFYNNKNIGKKVVDIIYRCLACKKCAKACPYGIDTSKILWYHRNLIKSYSIRRYIFMIAYLIRSFIK